MLVSIGRRPNTEGLGLEAIGLELNKRGQIETDHDFRTKVDGVWAIGDVIPGPMLAHKAEDEGIAVAENIAGQTGIVNHAVIPSVVYTMPEIAGVGLTEEAAKEAGHEVKVGKFPMLANSRAKTNHEPDGFVKVVADAATDRVLGVWIDRLGRRHDDRPGRAGDGVRRHQRGHRLHLPRPPDAFRGAQGSGDGGDRASRSTCDGDAATAAPRWPALLALALPVLAGLGYLAAFGAPRAYLAVNALALALGVAWTRLRPRAGPRDIRAASLALAAAGAVRAAAADRAPARRHRPLDPGGPGDAPRGHAHPARAGAARRGRSRDTGRRSCSPPCWSACCSPTPRARWRWPSPLRGIAPRLAKTGRFGLVALAGARRRLAAALRGDLPPQPFVEHVLGDVGADSLPVAVALVPALAASLRADPASGTADRAERVRARRIACSASRRRDDRPTIPTPLIGYGASAILGYGLALGLRRGPP